MTAIVYIPLLSLMLLVLWQAGKIIAEEL